MAEEDREYDEAHGEAGARGTTDDMHAEDNESADEDDRRAHPNLHDDSSNFAKLSEFLVLDLGDEVTDEDIHLIREYCSELFNLSFPTSFVVSYSLSLALRTRCHST